MPSPLFSPTRPAPPPSAFGSHHAAAPEDGHPATTPSTYATTPSTYAAVASLLSAAADMGPDTGPHAPPPPPGLVPSACYVTPHRGGGRGCRGVSARRGGAGAGSDPGGSDGGGLTPSGPRRPGQGVEDEQQGVVAAHLTPTGGISLKITLLAAGFIIGPSGASVREVCRATGADVRSWTEPPAGPTSRPVRAFTVEGSPSCVAAAASFILAAVDRYVCLTDGSHAGRAVPRAQEVGGLVFQYQPPPRAVVPHAAALKSGGNGGGSGGGGGGRGGGGGGLGTVWGRENAPPPTLLPALPPLAAAPALPSSLDGSARPAPSQGLLADLVAALQAHAGGGRRGSDVRGCGGGWPSADPRPPGRPPSAGGHHQPASPPGFGRAGSSPAALPPPAAAHACAGDSWGAATSALAPAPRWKAAVDAAAAAVAAHRSAEEGAAEAWTPGSPAWAVLAAATGLEAGEMHHAPTPSQPLPARVRGVGGGAGDGPTPPSAGAPWLGGTALFFDGPGTARAQSGRGEAVDAQASALAVALHNLEVLDLAAGSPGGPGGGRSFVWGGGGGAELAADTPSPHPPHPVARLFPPPVFEHVAPHHPSSGGGGSGAPTAHRLGPITPGTARAGRAASAPPPAQAGGQVPAGAANAAIAPFWPAI